MTRPGSVVVHVLQVYVGSLYKQRKYSVLIMFTHSRDSDVVERTVQRMTRASGRLIE